MVRDAAHADTLKPFTNEEFEQDAARVLTFARQRGADLPFARLPGRQAGLLRRSGSSWHSVRPGELCEFLTKRPDLIQLNPHDNTENLSHRGPAR